MAKYNDKELAETSKFLSFVLRHKPEAIGIVLDREGWADIDKLILCPQFLYHGTASRFLDEIKNKG